MFGGNMGLYKDLRLRNTWVKLIHEGRVAEIPKMGSYEQVEGEVAVYSDVRHCVQSPAIPSDQVGCFCFI